MGRKWRAVVLLILNGPDISQRDHAVVGVLGEQAQHPGDIQWRTLAPLSAPLIDPDPGDQITAHLGRDHLAGEVRSVLVSDVDDVPARVWLTLLGELTERIGRVPDRQHPTVLVRHQRLSCLPEIGRDATRFIQDDQHLVGVNTLEGVLVIV